MPFMLLLQSALCKLLSWDQMISTFRENHKLLYGQLTVDYFSPLYGHQNCNLKSIKSLYPISRTAWPQKCRVLMSLSVRRLRWQTAQLHRSPNTSAMWKGRSCTLHCCARPDHMRRQREASSYQHTITDLRRGSPPRQLPLRVLMTDRTAEVVEGRWGTEKDWDQEIEKIEQRSTSE